MAGTPPRRVLYLTGFFPPDVIAKRAGGIAAALASRGRGVTVITRWPVRLDGVRYPAAELEAADTALPPGVEVVRIRVPERRDAAPWRRILAQAAFATRSAIQAVRLAPAHRLIMAYTPPPFTGLAAWLAAVLARRPLVLEVQDLYPDQALALGVLRPGLVAGVAAAVERLLYRGATRLVVVTEGYRAHVLRMGAHPSRLRVIPNSCDLDAFRPDAEPLPAPWDEGRGGARPFTAVFAGTVGLAQGSEVLLDAAEVLSRRSDIRLEIWGGGARYQALERGVRKRELTNVCLGPAVPHGDMPRVLARGDALVVTLHPHPVFARVIPSKVSECLAMGRPVVAAALGEVPRLLDEGGAGLAVPPMDGAALAAALERLAGDSSLSAILGAGARALALARFGHAEAHAAFADVVAEAMAGIPAHRPR